MISILATKLYIPLPGPDHVPRPHLLARLNRALERPCKLILLSAPPGSGKTALLSEWLKMLKAEAASLPAAWVSLDERDNDPARFWACIMAALGRLGLTHDQARAAAAWELHHAGQPDTFSEEAITALINQILTDLPGGFVLVLDDYHVIQSPSIHAGLAFWLDHAPPAMRLAIACRMDPPLPIAQLRARGQLAEVRSPDLRFTLEESEVFLRQSSGLDVPGEVVMALDARTEGWVASLQLAALAMRNRQTVKAIRLPEMNDFSWESVGLWEVLPARSAGQDWEDFLRAFSGSHHYVVDYLSEQVLSQQSLDTQSFLLETSILDRLTARLCNAVTGRTDSQSTLDRLEAANLFLVALDDERCWYRYHHLFADALRNQLNRTWPDLAPTLHRRASAWCADNALIEEAIHHALTACDFERATGLLEYYQHNGVEPARLRLVLNWLQALPKDQVRQQPNLCLSYAALLTLSGQPEAAEALLGTTQLEALSPRELDVLRLVAAGASDREIAGQLVLSVTTVKSHLRNIYGKLQVGSRTQAVARARALRLLL